MHALSGQSWALGKVGLVSEGLGDPCKSGPPLSCCPQGSCLWAVLSPVLGSLGALMGLMVQRHSWPSPLQGCPRSTLEI